MPPQALFGSCVADTFLAEQEDVIAALAGVVVTQPEFIGCTLECGARYACRDSQLLFVLLWSTVWWRCCKQTHSRLVLWFTPVIIIPMAQFIIRSVYCMCLPACKDGLCFTEFNFITTANTKVSFYIFNKTKASLRWQQPLSLHLSQTRLLVPKEEPLMGTELG